MDFSDFNHFFSNIGYIILGAIFLLITKRRDYLHGISLQKNLSVHEVIIFFFLMVKWNPFQSVHYDIRLEIKSSRILPLTYITKCDMT